MKAIQVKGTCNGCGSRTVNSYSNLARARECISAPARYSIVDLTSLHLQACICVQPFTYDRLRQRVYSHPASSSDIPQPWSACCLRELCACPSSLMSRHSLLPVDAFMQSPQVSRLAFLTAKMNMSRRKSTWGQHVAVPPIA